ncbi:MAG: phosphate regulon transcriptional regulator PhoB [Rhodospirillales bacterium]|nr:phosphate regulon transcriptional regulator PhoB [Rhodospirillales bacterium]
MKPLVLVVEDEAALVEVLRYNLVKAGFRVNVAGDGETAKIALAEEPPDLVVLDWMLPRLSGLDVCRHIRHRPKSRDIPVIMLTARGEEADRVRGLDSGADDYMVKPFSPAELIARVRALLRRARPAGSAERFVYEDLVLDLATHKVTRSGRTVKLGPTEFRLLKVLIERPGRVFSREQLLDAVWGRDIHVEARTVDVHVRRLRQALNADGGPDLIRTVRATGYALERDEATPLSP